MVRIAAGLALLLLMTAGCTTPEKAETPTAVAPGPPVVDPTEPTVDANATVPAEPEPVETCTTCSQPVVVTLQDCHMVFFELVVDRAKVVAMLPDGYSAPEADPGFRVQMRVQTCAHAVFGTDLVVDDFGRSELSVLVRATGEEPARGHYYVLETVVTGEAAAAFLAEQGCSVAQADIVRTMAPEGATIVGTGIDYTLVAPSNDGTMSYPVETTMFDGGCDFTVNLEVFPGVTTVGAIRANAGTMADIAYANGMAAGQSYIGPSKATYTFHKPELEP